MAYESDTMESALHEMLVAHLHPIHAMMWSLGAPVNKGTWVRRKESDLPYAWSVDDERDTISFRKPRLVKVVRTLGEPVVYGRKPGSATVAEVRNSLAQTINRTVTYTRSVERTRSETKSMTHGWSTDLTTTSSAKVSGGVDGVAEAEVSIETQIHAGAHGEYSSGTDLSEGTSETYEDSIEVTVPPRTVSRVVQARDSCKVRVPFEDRAIFDVGFTYVDYKKAGKVRDAGWQYLHKVRRWRSSKSVVWFETASVDDLRAKILGQHRDYSRSGLTSHVKPRFEWLCDEDNRTVVIRGEAIYDEASATDVLVDERPYMEADR